MQETHVEDVLAGEVGLGIVQKRIEDVQTLRFHPSINITDTA